MQDQSRNIDGEGQQHPELVAMEANLISNQTDRLTTSDETTPLLHEKQDPLLEMSQRLETQGAYGVFHTKFWMWSVVTRLPDRTALQRAFG